MMRLTALTLLPAAAAGLALVLSIVFTGGPPGAG